MIEGQVVDVFAEMVGEQGWYEFSGLSSAHYIITNEPIQIHPAFLPDRIP